MSAWANSKFVPGQFTGSTGANILSARELTSGFQAWAKRVSVFFSATFAKNHTTFSYLTINSLFSLATDHCRRQRIDCQIFTIDFRITFWWVTFFSFKKETFKCFIANWLGKEYLRSFCFF